MAMRDKIIRECQQLGQGLAALPEAAVKQAQALEAMLQRMVELH